MSNEKKSEPLNGHYTETLLRGTKIEAWYKDGQLHREDGPAFIMTQTNGTKTEAWYKDGQYHREDGPAFIVIKPDGSKHEEWYLNGRIIASPTNP